MNRTGRIALVALFLLSAATNSFAASNDCGPYGDPSAAVYPYGKPNCDGGALLGPWKDYDRTDRYACLWEPKSAGVNNKLPMLVYLHPSLFDAGWITQTNILDLHNSYPLSDDPNKLGFIVLAPNGRKTTHYYPFPDNKGVGWDNWYRQLSPRGDVRIGNTIWRENADASAIDHFIAGEVASGKVDTNRIYISGWSNGAAMGILYAVNRSNIAAAAVYSGPNPFGAFNDQCRQRPVAGVPGSNRDLQIFNPGARIMHVRNSCDVGGICPNGLQMATLLNSAGVFIDDVMLDDERMQVSACNDSCGTDPNAPATSNATLLGGIIGLGNHTKWPADWTAKMLDFLKAHPLKSASVENVKN